jgi:hypothetical protein
MTFGNFTYAMNPAGNWRGCKLAANHADFWHAARDFARATLCGLQLAGTGMSESRVTTAMRECPACARARN